MLVALAVEVGGNLGVAGHLHVENHALHSRGEHVGVLAGVHIQLHGAVAAVEHAVDACVEFRFAGLRRSEGGAAEAGLNVADASVGQTQTPLPVHIFLLAVPTEIDFQLGAHEVAVGHECAVGCVEPCNALAVLDYVDIVDMVHSLHIEVNLTVAGLDYIARTAAVDAEVDFDAVAGEAADVARGHSFPKLVAVK